MTIHESRSSMASRTVRLVGLIGALVMGLAVASPSPASAANHVLYFHGRSMGGWLPNGLVIAPTGWQHVVSTYNGSARLADPTVRNTVKTMLGTYCRNGNACVVVCYSAGCMRVLLGIADLNTALTPATNMYWIDAAASAAGGSELASLTSTWLMKFLAYIFLGEKRAPIDDDVMVNTARVYWNGLQGVAPVSMYHSAGSKNICRRMRFIPIKICGNSYLPLKMGDGVVPFHSACGYRIQGSYTNCCQAEKYTNRVPVDCTPKPYDHAGMFGVGVIGATLRLGYTKPMTIAAVPDNTAGTSECNPSKDDCDAWKALNEQSLAQILNVTPADTNSDSKPDACVEVDKNGCARCYEYSIASQAYPDCVWAGTKTISNVVNATSFDGVCAASPTELRFLGKFNVMSSCWCQTAGSVNLTSGVTVSAPACPASNMWSSGEACGCGRTTSSTTVSRSGNSITVRFSESAPYMGWSNRDVTFSFSGATVKSAHSSNNAYGMACFAGLYSPPPACVGWQGNLLSFKAASYALVHPNDLIQ